MISSMTGFGRRQGAWAGATVTVEIRSVNHRFLEIAIRLPKWMAASEERLKKTVQDRCTRGRVDLSVLIQGGRGGSRALQLDAVLANQYHQGLRDLQRSLKLGGTIDIGLIAGFRDIVVLAEQPADDPKLVRLVEKLAGHAALDLVRMRRREGALLAKDILGRVSALQKHAEQIKAKAPTVAQVSFDRMKARVEKLLGAELADPARLHQELAVYADRSDITEELVRLDAHMIQFGQAVQRTDSAGKTMEFLLQEMGREINTIGSKANDLTISSGVVQMKAELERIREQIQNVE
jgi:uncharacterized protein (TIGR00255 family)